MKILIMPSNINDEMMMIIIFNNVNDNDNINENDNINDNDNESMKEMTSNEVLMTMILMINNINQYWNNGVKWYLMTNDDNVKMILILLMAMMMMTQIMSA